MKVNLLLIAIIGTILPNIFVFLEMMESGNFMLYRYPIDTFQGMFANNISSAFATDLLFIVVLFLFWTYFETKKLKMKNFSKSFHHWFMMVFCVAISFVMTAGCSEDSTEPMGNPSSGKVDKPSSPKRTLQVTIVDNAALIDELTLQYKAHYERDVKIESVDLETFVSRVQSKELESDIWIYPAWLLPELALNGQIREMKKDRLRAIGHSKWLRSEKKVGIWNKKTWGLSLGSQFGVFIAREGQKGAGKSEMTTRSLEELWQDREKVFFPNPALGSKPNFEGEYHQAFLSQAIPFCWTRTQIDPVLNRFFSAPKNSSPVFCFVLESR